MSKLLFYLIIKPLSLLPFGILYIISDFLYVVLYYVIGYRKKVVEQNLTNSFPTKTKDEIKIITKLFYRHLADLIIESVKLFSISQKEISKRFVVTNPEIIDQFSNQNRSVILVGGHFNNWEILAVGIDQQIKHQSVALYARLSNAFFEKVMLSTRGIFGLRMVTTKNTVRYFADDSPNNTATIFGGDQSPTHNKNVIWTHFLNQETAVAFGTEKYASKYNYPVIYGGITKVKRGYYSFKLTLITDQPNQMEHGWITTEHTRILETQILEKPEFWLWTHKRWKRKRKPEEVVLPKPLD